MIWERLLCERLRDCKEFVSSPSKLTRLFSGLLVDVVDVGKLRPNHVKPCVLCSCFGVLVITNWYQSLGLDPFVVSDGKDTRSCKQV